MLTIAKRTISAKSSPKPHSKASKSRGRQLIGKVLNDILLSSDPMTAIEQSDLTFLKDPQKLADFISAGGVEVEAYMFSSLLWRRQSNGKFRYGYLPGGRVLNLLVRRFIDLQARRNKNDPSLLLMGGQPVLITSRTEIRGATQISEKELENSVRILKDRQIIWVEQFKNPFRAKKSMHIFFNWDALTYQVGELFLLNPVHPNMYYIVESMIKNIQQKGTESCVFYDILKKIAANRFPPKPQTAQLQKQTRKIYRAQRQNPQLCIT